MIDYKQMAKSIVQEVGNNFKTSEIPDNNLLIKIDLKTRIINVYGFDFGYIYNFICIHIYECVVCKCITILGNASLSLFKKNAKYIIYHNYHHRLQSHNWLNFAENLFK